MHTLFKVRAIRVIVLKSCLLLAHFLFCLFLWSFRIVQTGECWALKEWEWTKQSKNPLQYLQSKRKYYSKGPWLRPLYSTQVPHRSSWGSQRLMLAPIALVFHVSLNMTYISLCSSLCPVLPVPSSSEQRPSRGEKITTLQICHALKPDFKQSKWAARILNNSALRNMLHVFRQNDSKECNDLQQNLQVDISTSRISRFLSSTCAATCRSNRHMFLWCASICLALFHSLWPRVTSTIQLQNKGRF